MVIALTGWCRDRYPTAILGKQQGLEVRVRAAQTVLDLEPVTW